MILSLNYIFILEDFFQWLVLIQFQCTFIFFKRKINGRRNSDLKCVSAFKICVSVSNAGEELTHFCRLWHSTEEFCFCFFVVFYTKTLFEEIPFCYFFWLGEAGGGLCPVFEGLEINTFKIQLSATRRITSGPEIQFCSSNSAFICSKKNKIKKREINSC